VAARRNPRDDDQRGVRNRARRVIVGRAMTNPSAPLPATPPAIGPVMVPSNTVPDRTGVMALFSQVTRDGDWLLPRLFRTIAVFGQVDLDLTRVRLGPGVSVIEVVAVLGQVTVIVPHNLRVECDGDSIIGEFSLKRAVQSAATVDAPLVHVKGTSFVGAVNVKVVDPNALGWFDRWRARRLRARAEEGS
jgi:hypothetical protein